MLYASQSQSNKHFCIHRVSLDRLYGCYKPLQRFITQQELIWSRPYFSSSAESFLSITGTTVKYLFSPGQKTLRVQCFPAEAVLHSHPSEWAWANHWRPSEEALLGRTWGETARETWEERHHRLSTLNDCSNSGFTLTSSSDWSRSRITTLHISTWRAGLPPNISPQ